MLKRAAFFQVNNAGIGIGIGIGIGVGISYLPVLDTEA